MSGAQAVTWMGAMEAPLGLTGLCPGNRTPTGRVDLTGRNKSRIDRICSFGVTLLYVLVDVERVRAMSCFFVFRRIS